MRTLNIDIETYSPVDLIKSGVYAYSEHTEFEILLFAYAFDAGQVKVIDIASGEHLPEEVCQALEDASVLKTAFNANFERTCINAFYDLCQPTEQWECTMVKAAMCGLPLSLAAVANVLRLEQKKMIAGKALIHYFSIPCKPTKANGMRLRNLPHHDADKWNTFKVYCGQDVEVERAIRSKIKFFEIPEFEKRLYILDQDINDRGVMLDREFVQNAISIDITSKERLTAEAIRLTGLDNPNSPAQLKEWIGNETGEEVKSLSKETIPALLENSDSDTLTKVLQLRQEMAKTSVKKYEAMSNAICSDSRVRGLLQFYGANRTGRWAGRLVQVQNLPQNHLEDLDLARKLVSENDIEMLEMCFGNIPDTLSQLIRTAFIAKPGHTFLVADFSAIEARVIAWLAGEKWRLEVFNTHGKIYEASASQMFKVPIESVVKGSALRQKGKISELALGYQGGVGALTTMGAIKMGLEESELQGLVNAWRLANPAIVRLWDEVGKAAMEAVEDGVPVSFHHGLRFEVRNNLLYILLPSGRKLSYVRPSISGNRFGGNALKYEGMNQTTKQWCVQDTYGGKLVENCLSAETLVLTDNGWELITNVALCDQLWDGLDWVEHSGLIEKGSRETIDIDGVRITPEHLVLTNKGWKHASQSKGYYRGEDSLPDSAKLFRVGWKKIIMAISLRLRKRNSSGSNGVSKGKTKVVRVSEIRSRIREQNNTRYVAASGLLGLAINESQVYQSEAQSLVELWGSWNFGLQRVALEFRKLLGGYGAYLQKRIVNRSNGCKRGLFSGKLSVGVRQEASPKQAAQRNATNPVGGYNLGGSSRKIGNWYHNFTLSFSSRLATKRFVQNAGCYEPVYDILNAGARSRFMVKSQNGKPFIVHNCVQAIARDLLAEAMVAVDKAGYKIVCHIHDEVIIEVEKEKADLEEVCRIMGQPIAWAPGLPLRADGYETDYYKKD